MKEVIETIRLVVQQPIMEPHDYHYLSHAECYLIIV